MFFRCFVEFDISSEDTYPLFLRRISSIAAVVSDCRFRDLVSLSAAPWIPHQLIQFVQTYFESLTLNATNPAIIRNSLTERGHQRLPVHHFRDSEYMFKSFHDNLRQVMVTGNLGFFSSIPQSYHHFFPQAKNLPPPSLPPKQEHRPRPDSTGPPPQLIVVGYGSIIPPTRNSRSDLAQIFFWESAPRRPPATENALTHICFSHATSSDPTASPWNAGWKTPPTYSGLQEPSPPWTV